MLVTRDPKDSDRWMETGGIRTGSDSRFVTWSDLERTLRRAGLLRAGERVVLFRSTDDGLTFVVERERIICSIEPALLRGVVVE